MVTLPLLLIACTLLPILALLAQMAWLGRRGNDLPGRMDPGTSGPDAPGPDEIRRHLFLGAFYVNPDDPRGRVPKLSGFGWTVNFRTRGQAILFIVLICLTLAAALLLIGSVLAG